MDVKVYPGTLIGTVKAPPSKSMAHRALICAALSDGTSHIKGISGSKDMDATIDCLTALGAVMYRMAGEDGNDDVVTIGIPMVKSAACSGCAGCGSGGCGSSSDADGSCCSSAGSEQEALSILSEEKRALIEALFYEEKSERDIAAETGVARTTLNYQRKKALEEMRDYMKKHQ